MKHWLHVHNIKLARLKAHLDEYYWMSVWNITLQPWIGRSKLMLSSLSDYLLQHIVAILCFSLHSFTFVTFNAIWPPVNYSAVFGWFIAVQNAHFIEMILKKYFMLNKFFLVKNSCSRIQNMMKQIRTKPSYRHLLH